MKDIFNEDYWKGRKFEDKYYMQALIYLSHVEKKTGETPTVFDYGCGQGYFVHAFRYFGAAVVGYDVSRWALEHPYGMAKDLTSDNIDKKRDDMVLCYDVLEHVPIERLDGIIGDLVSRTGKYLILSICMAGDPNFDLDKTHVTKRTKEWWAHQFVRRGLVREDIPEHFMFRDQLLIFRRDDNERREEDGKDRIKDRDS